ncbi:hypothetical protein [Streptosporangium sp. LJ11]|uniref:hypothetical protein n=1 Tax=Streptosporangium sp. LJ11 TaxID=3436927 RepID=UPI003F79CD4F
MTTREISRGWHPNMEPVIVASDLALPALALLLVSLVGRRADRIAAEVDSRDDAPPAA